MTKPRDTTKHRVTRFKNLAVALKELEPFIRSGKHLQSGRPFEQLQGMRSREAVANWLVCVSANFEHGSERMSFTSDPTGGDGIIYDAITQMVWKTEHVMVRGPLPSEEKENPRPVETQILDAVAMKQAKGGAAYASGKQLIIFLDSGAGKWYPSKVAQQISQPLLFDDVWIVGLHGPVVSAYVYAVTELDPPSGGACSWLVSIGQDFQSWTVTRHQ